MKKLPYLRIMSAVLILSLALYPLIAKILCLDYSMKGHLFFLLAIYIISPPLLAVIVRHKTYHMYDREKRNILSLYVFLQGDKEGNFIVQYFLASICFVELLIALGALGIAVHDGLGQRPNGFGQFFTHFFHYFFKS